jgi:hypothetical protein
MIYLHMKFHLSSSKDSLITVNKPNAKYRFYVAMMLFYILQKHCGLQ